MKGNALRRENVRRLPAVPKSLASLVQPARRQEKPETKVAEEFARQMVAHNYMIITGGGDGIMGAAQRGAGRDMSFGLNIRLPFEQRANETIQGDTKLINFNYFFTRKLNFVKETHAARAFPRRFRHDRRIIRSPHSDADRQSPNHSRGLARQTGRHITGKHG